jgi:Mn-dependent DtxR family transcriptional regulator
MMGDWTFFSNYGHVLVCLARNRDARLRDVAAEVGVTERAVQKIVRDLQRAGFLTVSKHGRCNRYRINRRKALRHALEAHCTVGKLLALVARSDRPEHQAEPADVAADAPADAVAAAHRTAAAARPSGDRPAPAETAPQAESAPAEKAGKKKRSAADTRSQGSLF